ncbi:hypothetical protein BDV39DRAFT_167972, partial [Aspergillus sergii]
MAIIGNQYLGSTDAQVLPILVMEIVYVCMYVYGLCRSASDPPSISLLKPFT